MKQLIYLSEHPEGSKDRKCYINMELCKLKAPYINRSEKCPFLVIISNPD